MFYSDGAQNEKLSKKLTGVVDIRGSSDFRLSVKLDGTLDLSDPEKKLTLVGGSYYPRTREVGTYMAVVIKRVVFRMTFYPLLGIVFIGNMLDEWVAPVSARED